MAIRGNLVHKQPQGTTAGLLSYVVMFHSPSFFVTSPKMELFLPEVEQPTERFHTLLNLRVFKLFMVKQGEQSEKNQLKLQAGRKSSWRTGRKLMQISIYPVSDIELWLLKHII